VKPLIIKTLNIKEELFLNVTNENKYLKLNNNILNLNCGSMSFYETNKNFMKAKNFQSFNAIK